MLFFKLEDFVKLKKFKNLKQKKVDDIVTTQLCDWLLLYNTA